MILAAGTKGKRLALPNSRILIHQPATEGGYGQSSDIEIQAKEILRIRSLMEEMLATDTGKSIEEVSRDIERDKYLTSEQALEYGIIDEVSDLPQGRSGLTQRRPTDQRANVLHFAAAAG